MTKRIIAAAVAAIGAPLAAAQSFDHDGLTFEGDNVELNIGGRIHVDAVTVNDDVTPFENDVDIRRLRVDATLTLFDDFRFKIDYDVGGISTGLRNAWGEYRGIDNFRIKGGNFIAPVLGENMKSSNNLKFVERSLAANLAPNFLLGGGMTFRSEDVTLQAGYFFNPLSIDQVTPDDDGESAIGRVTWSPIRERDRTLFFAASAERRTLDSGAVSEAQAIPEFGLNFTRLVDTGNLEGVESYVNIAGEAGFSTGPISIQGQYITRLNDAPSLGDPTFWGASVEAAWVITGERQRYSRSAAAFGEVRPRGDFGAVELAARFSRLDLTDGPVTGGEETNISAGLNWYVTRNVKLMFNYVHADADLNSNGVKERADAFLGRFQVAF